jgi:hypothetical protein
VEEKRLAHAIVPIQREFSDLEINHCLSLLWVPGFYQKPVGAIADSFLGSISRTCEYYDDRPTKLWRLPAPLKQFHAVATRQLQIKDHDIWRLSLPEIKSFRSTKRYSYRHSQLPEHGFCDSDSKFAIRKPAGPSVR